jgi:uncharacterized membrane protein YidH (DUF202 family)
MFFTAILIACQRHSFFLQLKSRVLSASVLIHQSDAYIELLIGPDTARGVCMEQEKQSNDECICMSQAQLILAEKRTSLSSLRTGMAVMAIPISVLSLLIVTSQYYSILDVLALLVPLMVITALLVLLGGYLIIRAIIKIYRYDIMLSKLKQKSSSLLEIID